MSDSLQPHWLQHTRFTCPSPRDIVTDPKSNSHAPWVRTGLLLDFMSPTLSSIQVTESLELLICSFTSCLTQNSGKQCWQRTPGPLNKPSWGQLSEEERPLSLRWPEALIPNTRSWVKTYPKVLLKARGPKKKKKNGKNKGTKEAITLQSGWGRGWDSGQLASPRVEPPP